MKLQGNYLFSVSPERLWDALLDPSLVRECIPGIKTFAPLSPDSYRVEIGLRVGIVSATYKGTMEITEKVAPSSYSIIVRGAGVRTNLSGKGQITLAPEEAEATNLIFEGDVQVTGVLARAGQRLMTNVAKQQIDRFFKCLSSKIA